MNKNNHHSSGVTDVIAGLIEKGIDSVVGLFLPKPGFSVFKAGEISQRWDEIERLENKLAVIEADKLVDAVLKKANVVGATMADRLRKTESLVDRSVYQGMWDAHKLRNSVVHDVDHMVSQNEIESALIKVKKYLIALKAFKNE